MVCLDHVLTTIVFILSLFNYDKFFHQTKGRCQIKICPSFFVLFVFFGITIQTVSNQKSFYFKIY